MQPLTRRRALVLASSFAAASLVRREGHAQGHANEASFDIASFLTTGVDADTAFAKAIADIEKAATAATKGGGPVHIVLNLQKNATYRIKHPLAFKRRQFVDFRREVSVDENYLLAGHRVFDDHRMD